jgi:hypothetical protein
LGNLHSILAPSGEGSTLTFKAHHTSFPDFVFGHSCPTEFQIVENKHHLELAKYCLEVMNKQLKLNICQVDVYSADQYQNLDDLLKRGLSTEHISKELQYAICYWANHLGKSKGLDLAIIALLEQFSKSHLMHWIEALVWVKKLGIAHTSLDKALAVLVG